MSAISKARGLWDHEQQQGHPMIALAVYGIATRETKKPQALQGFQKIWPLPNRLGSIT